MREIDWNTVYPWAIGVRDGGGPGSKDVIHFRHFNAPPLVLLLVSLC